LAVSERLDALEAAKEEPAAADLQAPAAKSKKASEK
jgi:hypothetical protein